MKTSRIPTDPTLNILHLVAAERARQESLRRSGRFSFTCASPDIPDGGKMMVLAEAFGEVAQAACEIYNIQHPHTATEAQVDDLQEELIQLAAVAVAWAEAIEADRIAP